MFTLKGRQGLGRYFVVPGQTDYPNDRPNEGWNPPARSSVNIVATEDSTIVLFEENRPADPDSYIIRLNKGQTYAWEPEGRSPDDQKRLVGATVSANKPVVVTVEQDLLFFGGSLDLAGDQLLPADRAGVSYIFVENAAYSSMDKAYVTAGAEGANLSTSSPAQPEATLAPFETLVLELSGLGAVSLESDNPVHVFQLSSIGGDENAGEVGGAAVPALECTGSTRVGVNRSPPAQRYFINILVPEAAKSSFRLNGSPIDPELFSPVSGAPEWAYANLTETDLPDSLPLNTVNYFTNSADKFHLAFGQGIPGVTTQFGYFSDVGLFEANLPDTIAICSGESREILLRLEAALYDSVSVDWQPSASLDRSDDLRVTATPQSTTTYTASVTIWERVGDSGQLQALCGAADSVTVVVNDAGAVARISGPEGLCASAQAAYAALDADGAVVTARWFLDGAPLGASDTLRLDAPNLAEFSSKRLPKPPTTSARPTRLRSWSGSAT